MSIIPEPVNDFAVLNPYLCYIVETAETLEIKYIFSHCDNAVYSKLLDIICKNGDEFSKVIQLTGGFYQKFCLQKAIDKHYACLGFEKWVTGEDIRKSSLVAQKGRP